MELFLSQLMNGIGNGVIYASLALALVLIFRTTGILNFAQGEMAVSFVGGAAIERVIIRPVEHSSPLVIVIVTIGLFLSLNALAQLFFGTDAHVVPRAYPLHVWRFGPLNVSSDTLVLVLILAVECALLYLLLQKTKVGLGLRAISSNADSSRLLGISVGTMLMFGWGLSAALGALSGALIVPQGSGLNSGTMQAI